MMTDRPRIVITIGEQVLTSVEAISVEYSSTADVIFKYSRAAEPGRRRQPRRRKRARPLWGPRS